MAGRLRHERFVEDEVRLLQSLFHVAERPLVSRLAERHLAVFRGREVFSGPLPLGDLRWRRSARAARGAATSTTSRGCCAACCCACRCRTRWCRAGRRSRTSRRSCCRRSCCRRSCCRRSCCRRSCRCRSCRCRSCRCRSCARRASCRTGRRARRASCRRRWRCGRTHPDVALNPRVRAAGPQRFDHVDRERERFELDVDLFDRLSRGRFVDGRDREHGLAVIERLVRQAPLGLRRSLHAFAERRAHGSAGHVVGREDRFHAGHRHRRGRVEPLHFRVRHRAHEELAEEHAVDAVVLGVLGLAGDFRDQVRSRVRLADEFVVSHVRRSSCARRRASSP